MSCVCYHCDKPSEAVHSFTVYDPNGIEQRIELLCSHCYQEWLHSLKG